VEALIRSCETLKHKALITFFLELGLRPHEVLSLRWEDIRVEGDVGEVKVFSSKVKESRTLPFKTSLIHILRWKDEYQFPDLSERHFVFPSENDPFKSANPRYMDVLFRRLCKKAGIRHIYPYLARHTRLTDMYKNLPEQVASSFAGHGSNMGAVYTHLNTQDIRQVVLERIYNIKDPQLSTLTAKKLNEEIEDLRSQMKTLVKDFENRRKYYDNKPL
jgi:integrase